MRHPCPSAFLGLDSRCRSILWQKDSSIIYVSTSIRLLVNISQNKKQCTWCTIPLQFDYKYNTAGVIMKQLHSKMGSLGQQQRIKRPHVVVFPYPAQGHMNPIMEFAKRLVCRNLHVTFIATKTTRERMIKESSGRGCSYATTALQDIRFETVSDGLPSDCKDTKDVDMRFDLMRKVGGLTFERVIERLNSQGSRSVSCIVYDALVNWVPHIANKFNIPSAFFWTQSCAIYSIYYHFYTGMGKLILIQILTDYFGFLLIFTVCFDLLGYS